MEDLVKSQAFKTVTNFFYEDTSWPLQRNEKGETFLHLACRHNRQELVTFIVSNSNLINSSDFTGNTALHLASESGFSEIVSILLKFKADPLIPNNSGDFPIHLAVINLHESVIDTFLTFKVDINVKNLSGESILHLIVDLDCHQLIEKVVHLAGLDLNSQDHCGWTALHLACRLGHVFAVQSLLALRARTDLLSVRGESVISVALKHGNTETLKALLEAQARISENDLKFARESCKPSLWKDLQEKYKIQTQMKKQDSLNYSSSKSDTLDSINSGFSSPETRKNFKKKGKNQEILMKSLLILDVSCEQIELEELIGRGEFGEVYRGKWRNTQVAVKKFFNHEDFLTELEVLGPIRHPNIVLLMATSSEKSMLLTEHLEKGSLSHFLASDVQLSLTQKVNLALDILEGLIFLHSSSVIHRDLKPLNCLVDRSTRCKIADFGLARVSSSSFHDSEALGTAPYMPPEVITSQKYSTKSDIFSFGVIFWEILYRKKPYPKLATVQVLYQVVHQVTFIQDLRPSLPQSSSNDSLEVFHPLLSQCWKTEADSRPSALEIKNFLLSNKFI
jgi:ankyrin repeat protein